MKTYYVYVHHVIDADLYYVGQTCNPKRRHNNYKYTETSLCKYLDFSVPFKKNPNIETLILPPTESYEKAKKLEDNLIQFYRSKTKCINEVGSGLYSVTDTAEYQREAYKKHPERYKENARQYREKNREVVNEKKRLYYQRKRLSDLQV